MVIIKKYRDSLAGLALLVLSGLYFKGSFIETSQLMTAEYGPGFMPKLYSLALAVLSILLIAGNLKKVKKEDIPEDEPEKEKTSGFRTAATIILVLAYIASMKTAGFFLSSAVYMILQLCLVVSPGTEKRAYIKFAVFGIAAAFLLNYLFATLFSLALPVGILGIGG